MYFRNKSISVLPCVGESYSCFASRLARFVLPARSFRPQSHSIFEDESRFFLFFFLWASFTVNVLGIRLKNCKLSRRMMLAITHKTIPIINSSSSAQLNTNPQTEIHFRDPFEGKSSCSWSWLCGVSALKDILE